MKYIPLFFIIGLMITLLGCVPSQTAVPVTTTRAVIASPAETPAPSPTPATEMPLPTTFTAASATLEPSQTPILTTDVPDVEPPSTQIPETAFEPFTQGSILFLWNENPPPPPEEAPGPYTLEPTVSLLLAQPGSTPEEWQIMPILTELRAYPPAYPSPDETQIVLLLLEDSEKHVNGVYRLHVYSFADGSLKRVENQENPYDLSWLPDSESFTYSQFTNIALTNLTDLQVGFLTSNPTEPVENVPFNTISQPIGSPNGQLLAMIITSGMGLGDSRWMPGQKHLAFFDITQGKTITVTEVPGDSFLTLKWSPNSEWLAFTHDFGHGLFAVNVNDLEVSKLSTEPTSIYYPSWSPDGRWLAFTQSSRLSLWDSETETTQELTSAYYVGEPAWSPDGANIAAGFVEEDRQGIFILDPVTGNRQELVFGMIPAKVHWSPDGQWLLFHAGQTDQSGLYIINRNDGLPHLVVDTSEKPGSLEYFTWLSE